VRTLLPTLLLTACYQVPVDLPPYQGVPVEATDACAPARNETVACVIDGDTFDISRCGDEELGERFRLLGIDAPETAKEDAPAECYANEARDRLRNLIEGQEVLLEFDRECEGTFGRTLAWVFLEEEDDDESLNVNVFLAESGLVRLYEEFEFEDLRYANELQAAEDSARAGNVGLWGACSEE